LDQLIAAFKTSAPQIIFHLAAQPLVREGYLQPVETFSSNVQGTVNLLEAVRLTPGVRVVVVITTDKVYASREWLYPYREDDRLGGYDPYSASKAASEIVASCYRQSFFTSQGIALATARSGNVIGGGDWSKDRIIPDAVKAWSCEQPLILRHPGAIRPWQHVLEPLAAYLTLAMALWEDPSLADAYNFGPENSSAVSVGELIEMARKSYGQDAKVFASTDHGPHESGRLTLETTKARDILGIRQRWSLPDSVNRTMIWYREFGNGSDPRALCLADIAAYGGSP
jgi:CDP-glucose 4,6-dehydratase